MFISCPHVRWLLLGGISSHSLPAAFEPILRGDLSGKIASLGPAPDKAVIGVGQRPPQSSEEFGNPIRVNGLLNPNETQNYWGFGRFPSSGILENTTFRKLDLFPSSGEGGGEDIYSVVPLRKS
jgi:hypothetical protein